MPAAPKKSPLKRLLLAGAVLATAGLAWWRVEDLRRLIIEQLGNPWEVEAADTPGIGPFFTGPDAKRPRLELELTRVAEGFREPTDIQFVPGDPALMVVLGKRGEAQWVDLAAGQQGALFEVEVRQASEEGLLGLAFHPKFADNGLFYLNYVTQRGGQDFSVIAEWGVEPGADLRAATPTERRVLLSVAQPYQNHDAGQLAFGPDGLLYVGWGDGGYRNDPHDNGQSTATLLGSMMRIDPTPSGEAPYTVPADNPWVGDAAYRPEMWAIGLRNPWRYSFAPDGRLLVADVGQDSFEEVSVVSRGANMGWRLREARHCFEPASGCPTEGLTDPFIEYGRDDGQSITGGFVYTGAAIPALAGRYVFGDFVSGRMWSAALPDGSGAEAPLAELTSLGKWQLLLSTFGQDAAGELYVADFQGGAVYKLTPAD